MNAKNASSSKGECLKGVDRKCVGGMTAAATIVTAGVLTDSHWILRCSGFGESRWTTASHRG